MGKLPSNPLSRALDRVFRRNRNAATIRVFNGSDGLNNLLEVNLLETVGCAKEALHKLKGYPVSKLVITHKSNILEDRHTLVYYGIREKSILYVWLQN